MMLILLAGPIAWAGAEELSARAVVEDPNVYVGDPFVFQIQVEGSDSPSAPDLSGVKDFTVQSMGGQTNSSSSITIINGQRSQVVRKAYLFNYKLTARREGSFLIPAMEVRAAGATVRTNPVPITARKPEEATDLKLRQTLSRTTCYVGEPVTLTVTLYLGKDIRSLDFNLPVLDNRNLSFADPEIGANIPGKYFKIPLGAGTVIAEKDQGTLDGRTFTTLSFKKIIFPKQSGQIEFPTATAACDVLTGYRGMESPFGDDFFGRGSRGMYKKVVATAPALKLEVRDLPGEGRPAEFSGLVGEYRMEAQATPARVNVGDPITLTVKISGPEYLQRVELPPLNRQKTLAEDFKIPEEMAPGKVEGSAKVFTQTIRAVRPTVKVIPSIELWYFNSKTAKYEVARTRPIPLTVNDAKVLTARDAEGRELTGIRTELENFQQGIAHNYEDWSVLEDQNYTLSTLVRSPAFLLINGSPAVGCLVLVTAVFFHRRSNADPQVRLARRAYSDLKQTLQRFGQNSGSKATPAFGDILDAVKNYLGAKLHLVPGSLTFQDVANRLHEKKINGDLLKELKEIFTRCEADRYAGGGSITDGSEEFIKQVLETMGRLEEKLK